MNVNSDYNLPANNIDFSNSHENKTIPSSRRYIRIKNNKLIKTRKIKLAATANEIDLFVRTHGFEGQQALETLLEKGIEIHKSFEIKYLPPEIFSIVLQNMDVQSLKKLLLNGDKLFTFKTERMIKLELLSRENNALTIETFLEYLNHVKSEVKTLFVPSPRLKNLTADEVTLIIELVVLCPVIQSLNLGDGDIHVYDIVALRNLPLTHLHSGIQLKSKMTFSQISGWNPATDFKSGSLNYWISHLPKTLTSLSIKHFPLTLDDIQILPTDLEILDCHKIMSNDGVEVYTGPFPVQFKSFIKNLDNSI